jgi:ribosome biogenesis GTPase
MHTTTYAEMFAIAGGKIIDIPGIKGFGLIDMDAAEIGHYFPEIFKHAKGCKFSNCLHRNEPDCAVRKAVDEHFISESRYQSYLSILEDISAGKYR